MKLFSSAAGGPADTLEVEKGDKVPDIVSSLAGLAKEDRSAIKTLRWGRAVGPSRTLTADMLLPNMETLILLPGVKTIGIGAFSDHRNLRSVIFPSSIKGIGKGAFNRCAKLASITIPEDAPLATIPANFACYAQLTEFTCPKALQHIGACAFFMCKKLRCFTPNEGLLDIGIQAFDETALTEMRIPSTLQTYELNQIPELQKFIVTPGSRFHESNGVLIAGDTLVAYPPRALDAGVMRIPEGVRILAENCACRVKDAKLIVLPESISADSLFEGGAFWNLVNTARCLVVSPRHKELATTDDGVLFSKDMTTLLAFPGDYPQSAYVIPASVTKIAPYAFSKIKLESLVFPNHVQLGANALYCASVANVAIHNGAAIPAQTPAFTITNIDFLQFYGNLDDGAKLIDGFSGIKTVAAEEKPLRNIKKALSGVLPQPRFLCI